MTSIALSKKDLAWTKRRLASVISRAEMVSGLAEKLWDTFRSLNYYRGTCRKTYGQLGVSPQNLWIAVASTAIEDLSSPKRRSRKKTFR